MHAALLPKNLEYYLQRPQRRYNVSLEALLFVSGYLTVWLLFVRGFLWTCWILPSLIGQVFLRMYLLAEHRECDSNTNMFSNTRTAKTKIGIAGNNHNKLKVIRQIRIQYQLIHVMH